MGWYFGHVFLLFCQGRQASVTSDVAPIDYDNETITRKKMDSFRTQHLQS